MRRLLMVMLLAVLWTFGCGEDSALMEWKTSYEPGLEMRGELRILRLKGSPYEMGKQHAEFLRDEIMEGADYIENSYLKLLEVMAEEHNFIAVALSESFPHIVGECEGMAEVLADDGWTLERCLVLAYGDVILAHIEAGMPGCSQFMVSGDATTTGELIHGRNLDWSSIEFMLKYPVVFVRHPEGAIPYVTVGFPGSVASYNGTNAAGLTIATNMMSTKKDLDREGRSEVQLVNVLLSTVTTLEDAKEVLKETNHTGAVNMAISEAATGLATVVEITANHMAFRDMDETGVVFVTNHFLDEGMQEWGVIPAEGKSTLSRYKRLEQLLLKDSPESLHGTIDLDVAVSVLRDTYNPIKDVEYPVSKFDGGGTLANNGCIYSIVFMPQRQTFYIAQDGYPITTGLYLGISLDELFGLGTPDVEPKEVPAL